MDEARTFFFHLSLRVLLTTSVLNGTRVGRHQKDVDVFGSGCSKVKPPVELRLRNCVAFMFFFSVFLSFIGSDVCPLKEHNVSKTGSFLILFLVFIF
jgi:hypothetical protein